MPNANRLTVGIMAMLAEEELRIELVDFKSYCDAGSAVTFRRGGGSAGRARRCNWKCY